MISVNFNQAAQERNGTRKRTITTMNYRYEIKDNEVYITGIDTQVTELTIPEEIDSKPVVAVERKAFLGMKGLRKVNITKMSKP